MYIVLEIYSNIIINISVGVLKMETPATKEDLVESFMEVATELKSEIDELMYTQQYLEVFDGNDAYDPTRAQQKKKKKTGTNVNLQKLHL